MKNLECHYHSVLQDNYLHPKRGYDSSIKCIEKWAVKHDEKK